MASKETLDIIANLIIEDCKYCSAIEAIKLSISKDTLFEPYSMFQRIDQKRRGYIIDDDFNAFFLEFNVSLSAYDFTQFVHSYGANGQLSYTDFVKFVLPSSDAELRAVVCKRESKKLKRSEKLPEQLENGLFHLLDTELKMHRDVEGMKEVLSIRQDASIDMFFKLVDCHNQGYVCEENLMKFLKRCSVSIEPDSLQLYLRKYDKNYDCTLSVHEFQNAIFPEEIKDTTSESMLDKIQHKPLFTDKNFITGISKYKQMKQLLLNTFESQIKAEHKLESIKIDLSIQKDFTIDKIFNQFQKSEDEYISMESIIECYKVYGCNVSEEDLKIFMKRYDKDRDSKIQKAEIFLLFAPVQKEYYNSLMSKTSNSTTFSKTTSGLISKILYLVLIAEREIELCRLKMKEYSLPEYFALCDPLCKSKITAKEVLHSLD